MKIDRYARDLIVGNKLYHWDGEGPAEPITSIKEPTPTYHNGLVIRKEDYLQITCLTYTMTVHKNDIRKIEA